MMSHKGTRFNRSSRSLLAWEFSHGRFLDITGCHPFGDASVMP